MKKLLIAFALSLVTAFAAGQGISPMGPGPGVGVTVFQTDAADFDGTNDNATRGATLTGIADGKAGSLSAWVRLDGGNSSEMRIFTNATTVGGATTRFIFTRSTTDKFQVRARDSGGTDVLLINTSNSYTSGATWLNVLISWDLAANASNLYVNNTSDQSVTTRSNTNIDYTVADWGIGANPDGSAKFDGCIAELWFTTTYIDFSSESNRRKFISATGKPVDLGANGSTPTGSQPLVYQRVAKGAAASTFATNLGTGGNFSITGSLDVCSTSPSG